MEQLVWWSSCSDSVHSTYTRNRLLSAEALVPNCLASWKVDNWLHAASFHQQAYELQYIKLVHVATCSVPIGLQRQDSHNDMQYLSRADAQEFGKKFEVSLSTN